MDAIIPPSLLSNYPAYVVQFLLALGNLDEAAHKHPPTKPHNPLAQDLPEEGMKILSVSAGNGLPCENLSFTDVNIIT